MALNFSFFKTPAHRVYHYEPRYYDERKERRERVALEAQREKAEREGREWKDETYIPGIRLKGKLREINENNRRHAQKNSVQKFVGIATIAIFFILLLYFVDYFKVFMDALAR